MVNVKDDRGDLRGVLDALELGKSASGEGRLRRALITRVLHLLVVVLYVNGIALAMPHDPET